MKIDILTLFPEMFTAITTSSMLGKAQEKGILEIQLTDIRDYSLDKHKKADDYPFGGGAGMVMMAQPVFDALNAVGTENKKLIYMSPRGKILNQEKIEELANTAELVILCGHYEGIDERIIENFQMEEISIGDYILTGGELPAMVLVDAVARLVPEVLGNENSIRQESIYSGLLECPQYTKPRNYLDLEVPEVLVSGNHKFIELWRFEKSLELTKEKRPELFNEFLKKIDSLTKEQKKIFQKIIEK